MVEVGIYDAAVGTAYGLANFTYQPIDALQVCIPLIRPVKSVHSVESEIRVPFTLPPPTKALQEQGYKYIVVFTMKLGINDILLLE